jgi:hypothetical protein
MLIVARKEIRAYRGKAPEVVGIFPKLREFEGLKNDFAAAFPFVMIIVFASSLAKSRIQRCLCDFLY